MKKANNEHPSKAATPNRMVVIPGSNNYKKAHADSQRKHCERIDGIESPAYSSPLMIIALIWEVICS